MFWAACDSCAAQGVGSASSDSVAVRAGGLPVPIRWARPRAGGPRRGHYNPARALTFGTESLSYSIKGPGCWVRIRCSFARGPTVTKANSNPRFHVRLTITPISPSTAGNCKYCGPHFAIDHSGRSGFGRAFLLFPGRPGSRWKFVLGEPFPTAKPVAPAAMQRW